MLSDFDMQKENALIEAVRQGQRPAFDELVAAYRQKGFFIAYSFVNNPEDAKDVLQEAFIKVYLNIKDFRATAKFYTWFYRIVVNCSLDFLRKRKKLRAVFTQTLIDEEQKEAQVADNRYTPENMLSRQELQCHLEECIGSLPEKQKACFVLKHQNGLSNQEIAHILSCSLSTVKVHLFRAVRSLQDSLSNYADNR